MLSCNLGYYPFAHHNSFKTKRVIAAALRKKTQSLVMPQIESFVEMSVNSDYRDLKLFLSLVI